MGSDYKNFIAQEPNEVQRMLASGSSLRVMIGVLKHSVSRISREVRRNTTGSGYDVVFSGQLISEFANDVFSPCASQAVYW